MRFRWNDWNVEHMDEPLVIDRSHALNSKEQEQWKRLKLGGDGAGRGQESKRISVRIEQGLIDRVTALARERRVSRSRLLAQVIEEALAQEK
jgi:hypothetical protein